jgi:hypothetical protein
MKLLHSRNTIASLIVSLICQGIVLTSPVVVNAGVFGANNYWECILDEMEGVKDDRVARAVNQACIVKFPNTSQPTDVSSPLFGAQTRTECFASYGKDSTSFRALKQIRMACHYLYPEQADLSPGKYLDPVLQLAE